MKRKNKIPYAIDENEDQAFGVSPSYFYTLFS